MSRMEEYQALLEELDRPVSGLDATLDRACRKRRKRNRRLIRPLISAVACFVVFVLLVNFSGPVAYACSRVPVLRELAEAVKFSRSLSDAVDNEYVQPISLSETKNGITASVDYLIVDQKQVNVFFRLDSDVYPELKANSRVRCVDEALGFGVINNSFGARNGELRSISIDFVDDDVPDSLLLTLMVYSSGTTAEAEAPESAADRMFSEDVYREPEYLAEFEFLLEFDPKFTAAGKVFPVNQTVEMDGQWITITDIEVYPTHLRVDVAESEENTAWLKDLDFYIETDYGMIFDPVSNGIIATGSDKTPSMVSYRADSTYFYEAKHLKLVITGAQWLDKDMERIYVNLTTGETGLLPEGVQLESAKKEGNGWRLSFRAEWEENTPMYQLFDHKFYDQDGNSHPINTSSADFGERDENGAFTYFREQFPLKNYTDDEVWLCPIFSHNWRAEDLIVITIQ